VPLHHFSERNREIIAEQVEPNFPGRRNKRYPVPIALGELFEPNCAEKRGYRAKIFFRINAPREAKNLCIFIGSAGVHRSFGGWKPPQDDNDKAYPGLTPWAAFCRRSAAGF
jgi:hypothetical protein